LVVFLFAKIYKGGISMERLTTDDIIPEMAIREMVSIDMQQLSRIYHRLRLYEISLKL